MPGRTDYGGSDKKVMGDVESAGKECTELETEIPELRASYEQYFLGLERLPPTKKHDAIRKRVRALKGQFIRQTALKFRIQSLTQKLVTYERLWERTIKEIENGTYSRDLFKARLHQKKPARAKDDAAFDVDEDLDLSDLDGDLDSALEHAEAAVAKPPAAPPAPPVAAARPPTGSIPSIAPLVPPGPAAPKLPPTITPAVTASQPAFKPAVTGNNPALKPAVTGNNPALKPAVTGNTPALKPAAPPPGQPARPPSQAPAPVAAAMGGLTDQKIKAIYDAYVMAKKRCGEDTRALTLDSVASTLKKQVPELMKQHKAKAVEFKVVIKDGKAVLRALPKEGG